MDKVVQLNAENFFIGQGNVLAGQGKLEEAVLCFHKALTTNSKSFIAYFCLGKVTSLLGDEEGAIKYYKQALKINPDSIQTLRGLYSEAQKICQWTGLNEINLRLSFLIKEALDRGKEPEEMPYESIIRTDDKELNLRTAQWWNGYIYQKLIGVDRGLFLRKKKQRRESKIRVGYLSADFREHPVMRLLVDIFSLHNRKKFEVFTYSFGYNDGSNYRNKVEKDSDKFVELVDVGIVERAKIISGDKIDILVDLMGFTGDAKPEVLALRPAPIQISYLGYPGSTGTNFLDYIITDKVLTPQVDKKFYSEKFIYINPCYQINSQVPISGKRKQRKYFNFPEKAFVFCSFNATYKIDPVMFETWMRILKRTKRSVLWIYIDNEFAKRNLRNEAKKQGVDEKRLVFVKKQPYMEYLTQLNLANLALDTRIYNGGATTSDLLRMKVPVITIYGNHYLSRMSSSLLLALNLPELVTRNLSEYEELAVSLANNPKKLELLKEKLKLEKNRKGLFDTKIFVKKLEKNYIKTFKLYLRNRK